jgi:hypothetical protein
MQRQAYRFTLTLLCSLSWCHKLENKVRNRINELRLTRHGRQAGAHVQLHRLQQSKPKLQSPDVNNAHLPSDRIPVIVGRMNLRVEFDLGEK